MDLTIIIVLTAYALLLLAVLQHTMHSWAQTIDGWDETLSELERLEMENDDLRAELSGK